MDNRHLKLNANPIVAALQKPAAELTKADIIDYIVNNDIYRMSTSDSHPPVRPFIEAPTDSNGTRHKLYGISVDPYSGDIYVADAVDYSQSGVVYRYSPDGELADQFRVGINPNGFAFK